jgi:Fur family peroxide stress response transcriptional regulator
MTHTGPVKSDEREVERRMVRLEEVCRSAGVKLTHQRIEIFRQVAQTTDHPDAETVHRGVRERIPTVSLDTVYRALWLFNDLDLIATLGPARERTRFDANLRRHHHFVCRRCGVTRDFYSDAFDELGLPQSVRALGSVQTTHVEARGLCRKCDTKSAARPQKKRRERKP